MISRVAPVPIRWRNVTSKVSRKHNVYQPNTKIFIQEVNSRWSLFHMNKGILNHKNKQLCTLLRHGYIYQVDKWNSFNIQHGCINAIIVFSSSKFKVKTSVMLAVHNLSCDWSLCQHGVLLISYHSSTPVLLWHVILVAMAITMVIP